MVSRLGLLLKQRNRDRDNGIEATLPSLGGRGLGEGVVILRYFFGALT